MRKIPGIMLAAPGSGSGKTLITCAMLQAFVNRKMTVRACKCGPDYIDPLFHERVLGIPSGNLDLYFTDEQKTRELFMEGQEAQITVIEGVMGLYDGLGGISEEASSYHLAATLEMPVILVVKARGMGRSLIAEISGFLSMDRYHLIKGVILNQITEGFYKTIAPIVEKELGIRVYGFFPLREELQQESRYLGLKLPQEVSNLREKVNLAAQLLEKSVDLDSILSLAEKEAEKESGKECTGKSSKIEAGKNAADHNEIEAVKPANIRIAIARDEAFCFYYRENLELLEHLGAELVSFSPLRDRHLPKHIHGLILGGGYPELHAKELSANCEMRNSIKEAIAKGLPSLAECGGFMYLHEKITDEQECQMQMCGVIPGDCHYCGKAVRFGYAEFKDLTGRFKVRGHEFHYYDSTNCGEDWEAKKPTGNRTWRCMHANDHSLWGFPHLYYPSCPGLAEWFVASCNDYKKETE